MITKAPNKLDFSCTWRTEPPTVEGWYFMAHRRDDCDISKPIRVLKLSYYENGEYLSRLVLGYPYGPDVKELRDAVWYGPIVIPPMSADRIK